MSSGAPLTRLCAVAAPTTPQELAAPVRGEHARDGKPSHRAKIVNDGN